MESTTETLLIIDYGSQYTQLIARRARELGVFSLIVPFTMPFEEVEQLQPRGIILSGGPNSVYEKDAPGLDKRLLSLDVPVLGICYGLQLITQALGGAVEASVTREYGLAAIKLGGGSQLLDKKIDASAIWMSHGDHVKVPPTGFVVTALSGEIICGIENADKHIFGIQFHPEVTHTKHGSRILKTYLRKICHFSLDWQPTSIIDHQIKQIRQRAGKDKVICALSGGVDSTIAATLVDRALGKQQTCIFVDNGLLRENE
ncbi:MAG TPA: glutamine-hydrolyzing GMP synthase, partial [Verrucomicrobiae bacterium]|nr:glutamine-hydrolyzing GMP synthase [Verrucomicrobiae bacterium]